MIRKALLYFLILGTTFSAHGAKVVLRDLQAKDDEYLKKQLPALFGGEVDPALLDDAIRLLMAHGSYENIFAETRSDGNYELIGKPIRLIEAIEFRGLHGVDEGELRDLIGLKPGDRFDRKRAVAAAERMKNYYGEHGFFNAIIELSFPKTANQNINLVFEIQEKQPCIITGLEFATANTDLKEKLDLHFRQLKQRNLTTERVRRLLTDLNEFLIAERYLAAEVIGPDATYNADKTKAGLKFEIREPWRFEFYMSGYQYLTLTDLYHALDLHNKERKNVDPPSEGAERLRRAYLEKGFPSVQIETRVENPKDTYLKRVYYTISEGPRVRIAAIEVQGRISRPSRYYQDFILANSSDLTSRGYYNRQDLENGFKNLTTYLRNEGFMRARVLSSRVEFNDAHDRATVFVLLEEGPQTEIRSLDFAGNHFFSSFELAGVTGLETNTALHLNSFEESIAKLKTFYYNQGFLEMKLLNEGPGLIQYNEKGTQARITFNIFEGPRIRVKNILVEGNTLTKSQVILKEADFKEGEVLTPQAIENATLRLNKLGLFARADIHTSDENSNVAVRTVVITVTERDPGVFRMGVGVTNERNLTLHGFTGASYSNLWGTGRGISLRAEIKQNVAQINYPEHEITGGFFEPFLFNTRTRGRINATRSEYVFDYNPDVHVTKLTTTNRVDLLTERDLTNHTKLTWKVWGNETNKDWQRGPCHPDPTIKDSCFSIQQVGTLGPTIDVDYRDSAFLPTKGSRTLLVTSYAPGFGSSTGINFIRTEGNYSRYDRLGSTKIIWANSIRGGYVSNLSRDVDSGVPVNYAFLLGGIYSIRGFNSADDPERIPKQGDQGFKVERGNQRIIHSDSHFGIIKTEIRFPIYEEHGGVIFYDGGMVKVSGYPFHRPYRDAFGIGYRYNTPVGPLALDLAFKVRPEPDEAPFRFHLSIGTF